MNSILLTSPYKRERYRSLDHTVGSWEGVVTVVTWHAILTIITVVVRR